MNQNAEQRKPSKTPTSPETQSDALPVVPRPRRNDRLLEPAKHLDLLDLLDRIAGNLHMRAFQEAREHLFNPLSRTSDGQRYAEAPRSPRSSETPEARKAYNYTQAAYERSRSRACLDR